MTCKSGAARELISVVRKDAAGLVELTARRVRARGREVEIERLSGHLPRVLKAAP
ncbi:hypothetical protein GCM10023334_107100 [Nonomuraea thailandensis]